jgi:type II secretory pathway pseudopilin PulG
LEIQRQNELFLSWHGICFCQVVQLPLKQNRRQQLGFTLVEVLVSFLVFSLVISGVVYGYAQVNRMAEFSSMSLAAQSSASLGLERARSAQWNYVRWPNTTYGPGTGDELGFPPSAGYTNLPPIVTIMDVPTTGAPIYVTNFVTISNVLASLNPSDPPMRQIRSDCVWAYPISGTVCTNTAIAWRAPDQ